MRTIKELLELMLEHQECFSAGLCQWNDRLYLNNIITCEESDELQYYINNNRPSKYSSLDAYNHQHSGYYWADRNIKPRIKWLKKHIKKNS